MPVYLDSNQWWETINVKIKTVEPNSALVNGNRPVVKFLTTKTHIFDENIQKELTSKYEMQKRLKLTEWHKYTTNKKAIITLVSRQHDEATLTKLALGTIYGANCNIWNIVNFFDELQVVYYQINDGGESLQFKLLHNFTNPRPEGSHGYKEELKIKYSDIISTARKFPNGTGFL